MNDILDRIQSINSKLLRKACCLATPAVDADDMYQTIIMGLLEKFQGEDLTDKTDSYILHQAEWIGQHARRHERIYGKYVESEEIIGNDEDGEISSFETFEAEFDVEEIIISKERRKALDAVRNPENRKIIWLFMVGYSKSEIADQMKISRPSISQRFKVIARQLQNAEWGPAEEV